MDDNVKYIVDTILKRIVPSKIYLFGSRASDSGLVDSDYDICIVLNERINRKQLIMNLYKDMARFGKPVDIIVEYEDEFEKKAMNKHLIYKDIIQGKLLYA